MCKNKDYDKDQKYLDDMVDGFIKDMNKESRDLKEFFKEENKKSNKDN